MNLDKYLKAKTIELPPGVSPQKKKKKKKKKLKQGKINRLKQKLGKLDKPGFGCKWEGKKFWYRVEFAWENEEADQSNFQLHWIAVREFNKKEWQFYREYMKKKGTELPPGQKTETQYLICYLEDYYAQNRDALNINNIFIYPAICKGDKRVKFPLVRRVFPESYQPQEFNQAIAAVYESTIWHEIEIGEGSNQPDF